MFSWTTRVLSSFAVIPTFSALPHPVLNSFAPVIISKSDAYMADGFASNASHEALTSSAVIAFPLLNFAFSLRVKVHLRLFLEIL